MRAAHKVLVDEYVRAEEALEKLQDVIDDKKFDWRFAQAGQAALQNLNSTSGQAILDQILADEAFDSVRDNFNQVFAELELEAAKLNKAKQLTFGGETIDVSAIHIPQLEPIPVGREQ